MKAPLSILTLAAALLLGFAHPAQAVQSTTIQPATRPSTPHPAAATTATAPSALSSILSAPTPSAVVDAYSRAAAAEPANLDLEKAYIHRMVELNEPEMADLQARNLVQRDSSDGLAWGVVAYMSAARGIPTAAIANIKTALQQSPDDPFILRTAGQIVAWYDAQKEHSNLSQDVQQDVEWIRAQGAGKPVYAAAYQDAQQMRRDWAKAAATQPATQPQAATTQPFYPATAAEIPPPMEYSYTAPAYTNPYVYYPVYPTYPYVIEGGGGFFSPGIIILHSRFGHHFHNHFFFKNRVNDGDFDHDDLHHQGLQHQDFRHDQFHTLAPAASPVPPAQPRIMTAPRTEPPSGSFNNTGHSFSPEPHSFGPQRDSAAGGHESSAGNTGGHHR